MLTGLVNGGNLGFKYRQVKYCQPARHQPIGKQLERTSDQLRFIQR